MHHRRAVVVALLAVASSACGEAIAPSLPRAPLEPLFIEEDCWGEITESGCQQPPLGPGGPSGPPSGWSSTGTGLYEAPGDPSPGAAGVWLGASVTPGGCFRDLNAGLADQDLDWLADHCELELARAFAPAWQFDDTCGGAEPHWAAKYFNNSRTVRLAFLPAYYEDCGGINPHVGDSEFVMVEVGFNSSTQHWEFRRMWLSAHYESTWYGIDVGADRSQWVDPSGTQFGYIGGGWWPARYLGRPTVSVSYQKHANYSNPSKCSNAWGGFGDSCYNGPPIGFPIVPARNVGSRFVDLVGCTPSARRSEGFYLGCETFYTRSNFRGWQVIPLALQGQKRYQGSTPYYDLLNSDKFESRAGDWGPGPHAPGYVPPSGGGWGGSGCADPTQIACDPM